MSRAIHGIHSWFLINTHTFIPEFSNLVGESLDQGDRNSVKVAEFQRFFMQYAQSSMLIHKALNGRFHPFAAVVTT